MEKVLTSAAPSGSARKKGKSRLQNAMPPSLLQRPRPGLAVRRRQQGPPRTPAHLNERSRLHYDQDTMDRLPLRCACVRDGPDVLPRCCYDVNPPVFLPAGFVVLIAHRLVLPVTDDGELRRRNSYTHQVISGGLSARIPESHVVLLGP